MQLNWNLKGAISSILNGTILLYEPTEVATRSWSGDKKKCYFMKLRIQFHMSCQIQKGWKTWLGPFLPQALLHSLYATLSHGTEMQLCTCSPVQYAARRSSSFSSQRYWKRHFWTEAKVSLFSPSIFLWQALLPIRTRWLKTNAGYSVCIVSALCNCSPQMDLMRAYWPFLALNITRLAKNKYWDLGTVRIKGLAQKCHFHPFALHQRTSVFPCRINALPVKVVYSWIFCFEWSGMLTMD